MLNDYKTTSHAEHLLQFHLIFICKFRCEAFTNPVLDDTIKGVLLNTALESRCVVHFVESDKDHIHLLIETVPNTNLAILINKLKSRTTYLVWKLYPDEMRKFYHKHRLWTRGYFVSTVGNISNEVVREYILNRGKE